jgi:hypothetical protein
VRRTIAIFANSVKHGMHCVAGKDVASGDWIRPVADASGAELNHEQCIYSNKYGRFTVKPLQKIEMTLAAPVPLINQPENHLLGEGEWVQRYKVQDDEVEHWLDHPQTLWGPGNRVSYDAIQARQVSIEASLYLVRVEDLSLQMNGHRRRAIFQYAGCNYDLPCTDPNFDQKIVNPEHQNVLCVSLGEPYDPTGGHNLSCYKIVATVI